MCEYTKIVFIADQNNKLNEYFCFLFAKSGKLNLKVTNMGHSVYFKSFLSPPALTTKMNMNKIFQGEKYQAFTRITLRAFSIAGEIPGSSQLRHVSDSEASACMGLIWMPCKSRDFWAPTP